MVYVFGDCQLDTHLFILRRAGQLIRLRPKVFQVLTYLLTHRDRVVSRQELCEQVWAGQYISDTALETTIRAVRQTVGDNGRSQRVIQTLHGHGYRFIAAVEVASEAVPEGVAELAPAETHSEEEPLVAVLSAAGERKLVTVLCCALAHTPEQREELGLEALHHETRILYDLVRHETRRFEGTLQQVTGDTVLAVFGAPVAQEDHARRAVLAALASCRQLQRQRSASPEEALVVRIGVHTGEVVAGGIGDEQGAAHAVVGDALPVATALQEHAGPGMILCSDTTARLVQGVVRLKAAHSIQVTGQPTPVPAYEVLERLPQRSPMMQREERTLSRFVGRARELDVLQALLTQVGAKRGQVVGIMGEPGIGKSRLVYEFRRRLRGKRVTYMAGRCLSYGRMTPYLPWLTILRHQCGVTDTDSYETITANVHQRLQKVGMDPDAEALYLLHLLGVEAIQADAERLAGLSPQTLRERIFETLAQFYLNESRQRPLVVEIEDLHWIDATSEDYLAMFVERLAGASILLLTTFRPGYVPPWIDKSYATQLALSRLMPRDSLRMVRTVLRTTQVPASLTQELLSKADGNPFFLEELAQALVEQNEPHSVLSIPDTVQAVLATRIDRLQPEAKRLLQTAAVIGKEMPLFLLKAVAGLPDTSLHRALAQLHAAEFLYETSRSPEPVYTFKHALTQDVAYQSLLISTRQQVHHQIARMMTEHFPETAANQPERVAHHYTEAGLHKPAVDYWYKAGQRAIQRSAHSEATGHLTKGLELLSTLPQTPERTQHELTLQTALSSALVITRGQGAHEVREAYDRARELCQHAGDTPRLFPVLRGLWMYYLQQEAAQATQEVAEQLLALAERQQDPALLTEAHRTMGATLYWLGAFVHAHEHLECAMALYDRQRHGSLATVYGQEPGVSCLCYAAWVSWYLGYPDQALQQSQKAIALAREGSHLSTLALALNTGSWTRSYRREGQAAYELAEEAIALSTTHEFPHWAAMGQWMRGLALTELGQWEAGIIQIRQGLDAYQATGAILGQGCGPAEVAKAYGTAGRPEEGRRELSRALALVHETGIRHYEAEIYRLQGEMLLKQEVSDESQAEVCFHQAIDIARQQQAKSWELRAATNLARLWQSQGKRQEAYELLLPVYGWFTEGFDTADLMDAKTLIGQLVA